ncbi:MAG: hypothetical protein IEMM0002_0728 [bacterium]|nr:MAG: hypothetical protein IEMM0002_0728 [bacterium]
MAFNPFDFFIKYHSREFSARYRLVTLLIGAAVFLVVVPALIIYISHAANAYIVETDIYNRAKTGVAAAFIISGLAMVGWSALVLWNTGKGTPAPVAPTKKLVVSGPYGYCANPMELGLIFYCFGLGTYLDTFTTGVIASFLVLIIGSAYNRLVEEKELALRFGDEYREYAKKTGFLIPNIWK